MASNGANSRPKKSHFNPFLNHFHKPLLSLLIISLGALLLFLHSPPFASSSLCPTSTASKPYSGDLRDAKFSWNSLSFPSARPSPTSLRIAVFSRKWPVASAPGGMERHAMTLHSALARRGHRIHVFTSAPPPNEKPFASEKFPKLHFLAGPPGHWRCEDAWALFEAEERMEHFDVVHSESVALHHK